MINRMSLFFFRRRKVKETLKIVELKCRHPDRWEQHANAQIQQGQFEQRIGTRLREISAARHDQSTHLINEFHRLDSMIDEEFSQISSYEKQGEIYRHFTSLFTTLVQSTDNRSKDLHEVCSSLNPLVQQRITQLKSLDLADDRSSFVEIYEEALNKVNFEFTKQFVHLGNIRLECSKVRERLNESKRDVLSRRSTGEQSQLNSILDAMISVRSLVFFSSPSPSLCLRRVNPSMFI